MRKRYFSGAVIAMALLTGSCAHAALLVSGSVGGAPTGVNGTLLLLLGGGLLAGAGIARRHRIW